jgi:hypothetical protein
MRWYLWVLYRRRKFRMEITHRSWKSKLNLKINWQLPWSFWLPCNTDPHRLSIGSFSPSHLLSQTSFNQKRSAKYYRWAELNGWMEDHEQKLNLLLCPINGLRDEIKIHMEKSNLQSVKHKIHLLANSYSFPFSNFKLFQCLFLECWFWRNVNNDGQNIIIPSVDKLYYINKPIPSRQSL